MTNAAPNRSQHDDFVEAIERAVRAPSSHNSQPWRFRIQQGAIELRGDASRRLAVVDPDGRELAISCGAVSFHVQCALEQLGYRVAVRLLPEALDSALLARLECRRAEDVAHDCALAAAIERRQTHRGAFLSRPPSPELLEALQASVASEAAGLAIVEDPAARRALAELVARGDRLQLRDVAYRNELAAWLRPNASAAGDGLRGDTLGLGAILSRLAPFAIRAFDMGRAQADKDHKLMLEAPAVAMLWTERDDLRSWLDAGRALAHMLLRAAQGGVSAGFMNQPVQCAALRGELAQWLGRPGSIQLVMRLGHARLGVPSSRRPVREVLD